MAVSVIIIIFRILISLIVTLEAFISIYSLKNGTTKPNLMILDVIELSYHVISSINEVFDVLRPIYSKQMYHSVQASEKCKINVL